MNGNQFDIGYLVKCFLWRVISKSFVFVSLNTFVVDDDSLVSFFSREMEWKGWRLQLFPKTKETANLMKDKIQFDSKYNFDLPINHYMFFLPSQKKRSRRVRFEYNIIFCCHVCMHRTLLHLILRNIPQSSVLVIFFVVRSLSTSFIHPCLLLSFSSALTHTQFSVFHFLFLRL